MSNGIAAGRIRLLNGEVVENHYYNHTATDRNIPVYISGNEITLKFYTEDFQDFDFNDSYITLTVSNDLPLISSSGNNVEIAYNPELKTLLANKNIANLRFWYSNINDKYWTECHGVVNNISQSITLTNISNFVNTTKLIIK